MKTPAFARNNPKKTHCPHGHRYTPANTIWEGTARRCRTCRSKATGRAFGLRTHCPKGHPYKGANLIVTKNGHRACRECNRWRSRISKGAKKAPHISEMTLEEQRDELLDYIRRAQAHCPDRCGYHCETTKSLLELAVTRYVAIP